VLARAVQQESRVVEDVDYLGHSEV
jgi:hypothetical protein